MVQILWMENRNGEKSNEKKYQKVERLEPIIIPIIYQMCDHISQKTLNRKKK